MLAFTDATGLAGSATAIVAASLVVPVRGGLTPGRRAFVLAGVAVVALTPFGGLSPAGYLRGLTGDLSITTLALLLRVLCGHVFRSAPVEEKDQVVLQVLVAVAGLVLYPLALGIGTFDPYRLGYASPWLMGTLLLVVLTTWLRGLHLATWCIALAALAYSVGWYESNNLWDYLLDPLVATYGLSALVRRAARRRSPRTRPTGG
jgi:hypothetical protein